MNIKMDGQFLETVKQEKDLGIVISNDSKFQISAVWHI